MIRPGEMSFDGYNFRDLIVIEDVDRPEMAPVDVSYDEFDGVDGCVFGSARAQPREITVTYRMERPFEEMGLNAGFERARRLLAGRLYKDKPAPLVLYDAPDLVDMAIVTGRTDIEKNVYVRRGEITFLCVEAASRGRERVKRGTGEVRMRVDGTYPTFPVVKVEADGPFSVFYDGYEVKVEDSAHGTVTIDSEAKSVTKDGEAVRYSMYCDIPEWEPGRHSVRCDHPFEVRWVERWR